MAFAVIQNKVDVSQMTEQEQKAFKLYGKVPAKNVLTKMQKDRKFFDSGDYMMSKAGVPTPYGHIHPTPEAVPHASSPSGPNGGYLSSSPTGNNASPIPTEQHHSPTSEKPAPNVGVGISPAATSEAIEMPGAGHGHQRRGSDSHPRISPPNTLRESHNSSSYPIHHPGAFGASPVKASSLAHRVDEDAE
ncbi:hypothetical protein L202_05313 [Cryptococcus amylolentus CBS 6039]|uniref:mRNA stability protein n=2 Tax=Cryptococcus amylolentus TaxID=104669 RepID=A0A1E3HML3_9TREE|nr:hypothetical protein L202_05313 [Cryptococcus amylolentus CBS 6039]ODN76671.1 hypothetical protein L202_05313 [Cryptococcus amylolentus CBS 6039]